MDVEYIEELITRVDNPLTKDSLLNKYVSLYYACKKSPIEDKLSYNIFKAMVQNYCEDIVDIDDKSRKEHGMLDN